MSSFMFHVSCIMCHQVMCYVMSYGYVLCMSCHVSCVICQSVMCYMSSVMCYMSNVMCPKCHIVSCVPFVMCHVVICYGLCIIFPMSWVINVSGCHLLCVMCHIYVSYVICHISCVMCSYQVSCVMFHLSCVMSTANSSDESCAEAQ
jgi:hypothetical protein